MVNSRAVVTHACNPSTLGGRGRRISEFEASLVYRVSSRTARAIQKKTLSQKNQTKSNKQSNKQTKEIVVNYKGIPTATSTVSFQSTVAEGQWLFVWFCFKELALC